MKLGDLTADHLGRKVRVSTGMGDWEDLFILGVTHCEGGRTVIHSNGGVSFADYSERGCRLLVPKTEWVEG